MNRSVPLESATRKVIDGLLVHLGWNTDEHSIDCNVFTERAKTTEQNNLLQGNRPDYLLYENGTNRPIAIIEAKRPSGDLNKAIQEAVSKYAEPLNINIVFATDGVLFQSFDLRSNGPLLFDDEPVVDMLSPRLTLQFAKDGPSLHKPTKNIQTKRELMNIFKKANNLLRAEGLREGIERFSEFSNLLFLKLISEIEIHRENQNEPRRLDQRYCWESFSSKSAHDMLDYLNDTVLPRLVSTYNHSSDVFQPRLAIVRPETLKAVVDGLSSLSLLNVDSDVKGDAFEYFLKHSITVGNDLGEYFTPRHIVKLIVDLIDPTYMEQVYDPCCGTGGFLIEAYRHIALKVKSTEESKRFLENDTIFGRELTGTARIAKMNMILAGDGHTHIDQCDCLENPIRNEFDVVLTNFPFSQKTNHGSFYGFNTEDANPIFLKHAVDACKDGGRIGIVVPEGLLFTESQEYEKVRKYVIDNCQVIAVIALHKFAFSPYTGQPTAILILKKGSASTQPVWFFDVENDGFEKTNSKKGRPPCSNKNDIITLRNLWPEKSESERSFFVSVSRIRNNTHKLSLNVYRSKQNNNTNMWIPLGGSDGLYDIVIGATPRKEVNRYWTTNGNGHIWVKISDMDQRYVTKSEKTITEAAINETRFGNKKIPKGTVLLSFKLTIGKVAIAGCDLFTNEAIAGFIPKDDRILPEYLYHLLPRINLQNYMQRAAKGMTLNKRILKNVRIPVPSIEEQTMFIEKMNELETKVIELRKEINTLEQEMLEAGKVFIEHLS